MTPRAEYKGARSDSHRPNCANASVGVKLDHTALAAHPARAAALATAKGVEDLLAIMVRGTHERPPRKAVEALAFLILGIVLASGCGVVEWVASPYTDVVYIRGFWRQRRRASRRLNPRSPVDGDQGEWKNRRVLTLCVG